jgi:hypothetical protein
MNRKLCRAVARGGAALLLSMVFISAAALAQEEPPPSNPFGGMMPGRPPGGISGDSLANIHGHAVRYKADLTANMWLGGKIWKLVDGGTLSPE